MILADTSIWIGHFRSPSAALVAALEAGTVFCHPHIIGELACGNVRDRARTLEQLGLLPVATLATHAEALALLERHRLHGAGLGYTDVQLLASTLLTPNTRLWTLDGALARVANRLGVGDQG